MASVQIKFPRGLAAREAFWFGLLVLRGGDRSRSFGQGDEEGVVDVLVISFLALPQHLENTRTSNKDERLSNQASDGVWVLQSAAFKPSKYFHYFRRHARFGIQADIDIFA